MNFSNALYFLIGMTVSQSGLRFTQVFRATTFAIVPFVILCCFPANLDRGTLAGVAITWLSISLLLAAYGYLPAQAKRLAFFIGRNTLVILLFSPIFTILSKRFCPCSPFDPTGMLFLVTATAFTLSGCMGMAWGYGQDTRFQILLREEYYIVLRRFTSPPTKGSFTTNSFSSLRISTSVPYRAYCRCRFFNPAPLLVT